MNWYAAHLILYVKLKNQQQDRYPVWENIILLKADSEDEAFARAESHGHAAAGDDDGSFRWDGAPATWEFAGVRKLTLCQEPAKRPGDGTEIAYTEMEAASLETVQKLASGEPASLRFTETFRAAPHEIETP